MVRHTIDCLVLELKEKIEEKENGLRFGSDPWIDSAKSITNKKSPSARFDMVLAIREFLRVSHDSYFTTFANNPWHRVKKSSDETPHLIHRKLEIGHDTDPTSHRGRMKRVKNVTFGVADKANDNIVVPR